MTIELLDIDVSYQVCTDVNDNGTNFVRIVSQCDNPNRDDIYDICLNKADVEQLIRVLTFIKEEIFEELDRLSPSYELGYINGAKKEQETIVEKFIQKGIEFNSIGDIGKKIDLSSLRDYIESIVYG